MELSRIPLPLGKTSRESVGAEWDVRRVVDAAAAVILLLVSLPLLAVSAAAVLLTTGRPVFFGHLRIGRGGRIFRCWKVRTMEPEATARLERDSALRRRYVQNGYKVPTHEDPRVTRVGRVLRLTRLDELPQLCNVLRGEMSMVGPRPLVEEELAEYEPDVDRLLSVRPGIVGAWTSLGRDRPGYPERARIELDYVDRRSPARDLGILLRSLIVVARGGGSRE